MPTARTTLTSNLFYRPQSAAQNGTDLTVENYEWPELHDNDMLGVRSTNLDNTDNPPKWSYKNITVRNCGFGLLTKEPGHHVDRIQFTNINGSHKQPYEYNVLLEDVDFYTRAGDSSCDSLMLQDGKYDRITLRRVTLATGVPSLRIGGGDSGGYINDIIIEDCPNVRIAFYGNLTRTTHIRVRNSPGLQIIPQKNKVNPLVKPQPVITYDDTALVADAVAPTIPRSLRVVGKSATTVNLAWNTSTDNVRIRQYKVYRDGIPIANTEGLVYTDSGLTANTVYTYQVYAQDDQRNTSGTETLVVTTSALAATDTTAPPNPAGLAKVSATVPSITLKWNASVDVIGGADSYASGTVAYKVYRGSTLLATVTTTSYTATGLTANTTYTFTVKAVDAEGNMSSGAILVASTQLGPDSTAPSTPGTPTSGAQTATTVDLAWSASTDTDSGVSYYNVWVDGLLWGTVVGDTEVTVTGLEPDTEYDFSVSAVDEAGNESEQSVALEQATAQDTDAPDVTGSTPTLVYRLEDEVKIQWSPAVDETDITSYIVYRDGISLDTTTELYYVDTSVASSTSYDYSIKAVDSNSNESAESAALTVTTLAGADATPPTAPGTITDDGATANAVSFSWVASTDADSGVVTYHVEYTLANPVNWSEVVAVTTTSASVAGLTEETVYAFRIRARDGAGNYSAYSATHTKSTAAADVVTPDAAVLPAERVGSESLALSSAWHRYRIPIDFNSRSLRIRFADKQRDSWWQLRFLRVWFRAGGVK